MSDGQLEMSHMLAEADERARAIKDLHLGRVQEFFDTLPIEKKRTLSQYMTEHEYDTCLALSMAAGDWYRGQLNGGRK